MLNENPKQVFEIIKEKIKNKDYVDPEDEQYFLGFEKGKLEERERIKRIIICEKKNVSHFISETILLDKIIEDLEGEKK